MKAYVTKYALTAGIEPFDGEIAERVSSQLFCYRRNGFAYYAHGEGKDWHRTWESAVERARQVRDKELKALTKQIKKLEALDWPDAEPL